MTRANLYAAQAVGRVVAVPTVPQKLERQLGKITTALLMLDSDIISLVELENNANRSLALIVDALNSDAGAGTYAYVDTGAISSDAIKNGFYLQKGDDSRVRFIRCS